MKKVIKLSLLAMVASLVVGCATNSDVENLQSQIDGMKVQVSQVSADAQNASQTAATASVAAGNALDAANRAAQASQDVNSKLDNMFKTHMMK